MMSENMYDFRHILYKFRNSLQKPPLDVREARAPISEGMGPERSLK